MNASCRFLSIAAAAAVLGLVACGGKIEDTTSCDGGGADAGAVVVSSPDGSPPDVGSPDAGPSTRPPSAGLIGYWDFEQPPPTVTDESGNGNDGTSFGASQGPGKIGMGYTIGNDECIGIPASPSLDMNGGTGVTMMAWAKYAGGCGNASTGPNDRGELLNKENTYEMAAACAGSNGPTDAFQYALQTGSDGISWTWSGTTPMNLGTWHLYAVTWDGATVLQYVDGVVVGSQAQSGAFVGTDYGLGIGCRTVAADGTTADTSSWWVGSVDEVSLYDRPLATAEIAAYFDATE